MVLPDSILSLGYYLGGVLHVLMHWNSDVNANYFHIIFTLQLTECHFSHTLSNKENICHVYDEMLAVYTLAGPPVGDESSATYSTIQLPAPADNDCSP